MGPEDWLPLQDDVPGPQEAQGRRKRLRFLLDCNPSSQHLGKPTGSHPRDVDVVDLLDSDTDEPSPPLRSVRFSSEPVLSPFPSDKELSSGVARHQQHATVQDDSPTVSRKRLWGAFDDTSMPTAPSTSHPAPIRNNVRVSSSGASTGGARSALRSAVLAQQQPPRMLSHRHAPTNPYPNVVATYPQPPPLDHSSHLGLFSTPEQNTLAAPQPYQAPQHTAVQAHHVHGSCGPSAMPPLAVPATMPLPAGHRASAGRTHNPARDSPDASSAPEPGFQHGRSGLQQRLQQLLSQRSRAQREAQVEMFSVPSVPAPPPPPGSSRPHTQGLHGLTLYRPAVPVSETAPVPPPPPAHRFHGAPSASEESDEQLAARLQRREQRRLGRAPYVPPWHLDDDFHRACMDALEQEEFEVATASERLFRRPDSPNPFAMPSFGTIRQQPAVVPNSSEGTSAAPRVPDAWRRSRSSRTHASTARHGWGAAVGGDVPSYGLLLDDLPVFPEDLMPLPVQPPAAGSNAAPSHGRTATDSEPLMASSYRPFRGMPRAPWEVDEPERGLRFAMFREVGWPGRASPPPGATAGASHPRGRLSGWSHMMPGFGGSGIQEMIAGAMRSGLPPHLLFSDRDFTADDYEMLCRLDETVENRKGAAQQEIDALPTQVVVSHAAAAEAVAEAAGIQAADFGAADSVAELSMNPTTEAPCIPGSGRCTICLEDWSEGDVLRHLPCTHHFHKDCVDTWLRQKAACPICQRCCKTGGSCS